jgi:hypothetical protein
LDTKNIAIRQKSVSQLNKYNYSFAMLKEIIKPGHAMRDFLIIRSLKIGCRFGGQLNSEGT